MKRKMKTMFCSLQIAFSMYSRIPAIPCRWTKDNMRYVMCFFPLVGAVIGLLEILWWKAAMLLQLPESTVRIVLLLIPCFVTGGIHLDGMMDTCDAMASYRPMERRLEILKDPHTGAFAVLRVISWFLLLYAFLSMMEDSLIVPYACLHILSRAASALSVVLFRKSSMNGTVTRFGEAASKKAVCAAAALWAAAAAAVILFLQPVPGICVLAGAAACLIWYRRRAYRYFGGINGDLAGWFLCICELVTAGCLLGTAHILQIL